MYYDHVLILPGEAFRKSNISLRVGFEPTREDPIGFQVQRLNHSAIAATLTYSWGCSSVVERLLCM